MKRVLIIDDNRDFGEGLTEGLRRTGYAVQWASSGEAGLRLAAETPPRLIFLDLRLSDMSGIEVLNRLRAFQPDVDVVIVTAYPELPSALAAIRGRVRDYLTKPVSMETVAEVARRIFTEHSSGSPNGPRAEDGAPAAEMIGVSPAITELRRLIRQFASSGMRAALITGESGTGKELVARLFHAESPRRAGPFVEVNCSAVSESLFEAEFFGHERGAFTGSVGARRGLVELADGGTLFLDEVGEIPLSCQSKLLRFLDDHGFLKVGGGRKARVDVQVVAATNRDLRDMVAQWTFRQDLYFRLNLAPIVTPALRQRREDIPLLAKYWIEESNRRYGKKITGLTPEAEDFLLAYDWPGNVRELRNLIERLVVLCPGEWITHAQLPPDCFPDAATAVVRAEADSPSLGELERIHIRKVLARVSGNKTKAAEILGITRQTLRSKLV